MILVLALLLQAQDVAAPIIVPSQSSIYNQNSVNLPSPPSVHGQDVVRAADGVSCQTAVGSGGPYIDLGVIGSQDVFARDTAAVYGRVVVPLGKRARRVDCTRLYELEITRMRMELDLLRMGLAADGPGLAGGLEPLDAEAPEPAIAPPQGPVASPALHEAVARRTEAPRPAPPPSLRPAHPTRTAPAAAAPRTLAGLRSHRHGLR